MVGMGPSLSDCVCEQHYTDALSIRRIDIRRQAWPAHLCLVQHSTTADSTNSTQHNSVCPSGGDTSSRWPPDTWHSGYGRCNIILCINHRLEVAPSRNNRRTGAGHGRILGYALSLSLLSSSSANQQTR